ncbi:MAG TPA: NUDIX domain-containing protein [Bacteroidales bacterium]|nr:NUDIX domain-containing protein [Bacteroidales bacterium]HSA44220.1 NUDIX domain-containing protein [Bacteroidales bacterium]
MFLIRIYGIFIDPVQGMLVTDEYRLDTYMTKFPGGGLEYGEGSRDCLKRECLEELGQEVVVMDHFYTTDFFQQTMLLPDPAQLISIYYRMRLTGPPVFPVATARFEIPPLEGSQSFRFIPLETLDPEEFTFPVDRLVARMLKKIPM